MPDKKPTFEELVTEMGMDPTLVKSMVQHLQAGNEQEAVWRAWCTPLIEQARRLEAIVNNCPEHNTRDTSHSLNRPGVYISLPEYGSNPHLNIRVPDLDGFSVKCEPRTGVYLYNHLARRTATGDICGSTEVYAHLEKSWYEQSVLLQENWKTVFGNAPAVLDAAEYSLNNGTPLGTTQSWEKALLVVLERQHKNEIDPSQWRRWAQHWGTPEMASAIGVVDSLFDSSNVLVWREQLLQAWKGAAANPTEPMADLDAAVFSNT